ncbi:MAG: shikimate kinase [Syntrophales bacterium]|jgi:shikimate kinase|nr:shikimate kinase [Syntrophales bacterium]
MTEPVGNILLVGYRGTGKSTLGKRLADVLEMNFIDMDRIMIKDAGCCISRIVEEHGWPHFRELEKILLLRLAQAKGQVIATGGGVVLDAENRTLLSKMGIVIWLKADPNTILKRLHQDKEGSAQRPPLSDKNLWEETTAALQERTPLYKDVSEVELDTSNLNIAECVDEIVRIVHTKKRIASAKG